MIYYRLTLHRSPLSEDFFINVFASNLQGRGGGPTETFATRGWFGKEKRCKKLNIKRNIFSFMSVLPVVRTDIPDCLRVSRKYQQYV